MEYTPGPWKVSSGGRTVFALNDQGTNRFDVQVSPGHVPGYDPEEIQQANAQLIAAAPEMYEALKIIAEWDPEEDPNWADGLSILEAIDIAKNAIATVERRRK